MLPQHLVYKNELSHEHVITLARNSLMMIKSKYVGVVLGALSESYIGAFVG